MRTVPTCLTCVLGDVYAAARQVTADPAVQLAVVKDCLAFLADTFDLQRVPWHYITEVHRILKRDTGVAMPFADSRSQLNQVAMRLADTIQTEAETLDGLARFRFLALWALAGNSLDSRTVGIGYSFEAAQMLRHLHPTWIAGWRKTRWTACMNGLWPGRPSCTSTTTSARSPWTGSSSRRFAATAVMSPRRLRGGPITSDATMEDGRTVGLDRAVDRLVQAGPDTLGISWDEASTDLRDAMQAARLIIAKGQANYYVFSEHRAALAAEIFCLFAINANRWRRWWRPAEAGRGDLPVGCDAGRGHGTGEWRDDPERETAPPGCHRQHRGVQGGGVAPAAHQAGGRGAGGHDRGRDKFHRTPHLRDPDAAAGVLDMWSLAYSHRIGHIEATQRADVLVVAPATARTIARLALGLADDFLSCIYLASRCPVLVAPAMDCDMFDHPALQENLKRLRERGVHLVEPEIGPLASAWSDAAASPNCPRSSLSSSGSWHHGKTSRDG